MKRLLALLLLFVVSAAVAAAPPYVVSSRTSNALADIWEYDLYRVDTSGRTRLTTRPGPEGEPAVDPTGRLLAFVAPVDGHFQLFTMPQAGGEPRQRTTGLTEAGHPSFDPTGTRLAFPAQRDGGRFALAILDLADDSVHELVQGPFHCWSPEWSPDGRAIAFVSDRDGAPGSGDLYRVHVETGTVDRLTDDPLAERDPHWSPDGRRLVYSRRVSRDHAELWMLDLARATRAPLFAEPGLNLQPSFTPSGDALLFTSNRAGTFNIWQLDLARGSLTPCDAGPHSDQNARPLP